jgi:hypothetical protein
MAFRRFRKQWEYKNDAGEKVTIPRNWGGELPDDVAGAADKAGVTLIDKSAKAAANSEKGGWDKLNKDVLIAEAARRQLTVKSSANKPDLVAALNKATAPFTADLAGLDTEQLKVEAASRGVEVEDGADDAALVAALNLAAEPIPA